MDNNNSRPWNRDNRNRNGGNRQEQQKNRLREKELALKTAKVNAFQRVYEEQIKSLDRHEAILREIIPPGFGGKVTSGKTATLPKASGMIASINSYFSKIGLAVSGADYQAIMKFLGEYHGWRDEKMAEYKTALEENIMIHATVIDPEIISGDAAK